MTSDEPEEYAWQRYLRQTPNTPIERVSFDGVSPHVVCRPRCGVCDKAATYIELVPPGQLPSLWDKWHQDYLRFGHDLQGTYRKYHDESRWRLLFEGIAVGNGLGSDVDPDEIDRLRVALTPPLTYQKLRAFAFCEAAGVCEHCGVAYCYDHWDVSPTGGGMCPNHHMKILDSYWSPES